MVHAIKICHNPDIFVRKLLLKVWFMPAYPQIIWFTKHVSFEQNDPECLENNYTIIYTGQKTHTHLWPVFMSASFYIRCHKCCLDWLENKEVVKTTDHLPQKIHVLSHILVCGFSMPSQIHSTSTSTTAKPADPSHTLWWWRWVIIIFLISQSKKYCIELALNR